MNRRGLILSLGATLITAPAIVRAASLMAVKAVDVTEGWAFGKVYYEYVPPRHIFYIAGDGKTRAYIASDGKTIETGVGVYDPATHTIRRLN